MPHHKIATCCYCGTRAALVLRGRERHELSCASCGAPLHEMKMLRADHVEDSHRVDPSRLRGTAKPKRSKHKKSKKKSGLLDVLDDAFDLLDDIFD